MALSIALAVGSIKGMYAYLVLAGGSYVANKDFQ